jgi:hypothetical protein
MITLLSHDVDTDSDTVGSVARASFRLVITNDPEEADEPELDVVPEAVAATNEATEVIVKEVVAPNEAISEIPRVELRDRSGRVWGLGDGSNPLVGDLEVEIDKV